jgi:hypothetical protein
MTSVAFAQDQPQYKVGDKVMVKNMSAEWVPASIIKIEDWRSYGRGFAYRVHLDDANAPNTEWAAFPDSLRLRTAPTTTEPKENAANDQPAPPANADAKNLKVGDRVDTFYNPKQGDKRGTVIAVGDSKLKVHFDGCDPVRDQWFDHSLVRTPATISPNDPQILFLVGKWSMTTVATSALITAWGKTNGLQINRDGTYVWYQDGGKPPVRGRWQTDAKVPGATDGLPALDGILIKDAGDILYKVYRWNPKGNTEDHITVERVCFGTSDIGRRVR